MQLPLSCLQRLIVRRGSLAPVSAERPAHAEGGIKPVRAIGAKVPCRRAKEIAVTPEPIHLMLRGAKFEVSRQLKTDSDRTFVSNRQEGCGVGELGEISAKAEFGFEEEKEMPRGSSGERLQLHVCAE